MRAYVRTFGCRANQYDSERVRAMILAAGGTLVESAAAADVAIFNSCAVTTAAEADLRQAVRREAAPASIVMGCAAALDTGAIAALPRVRAVVAGDDMEALAAALGIDPIFAATPRGVQTGSRALLRIQDGCDEHCTFCATTQARGNNRSRAADEIVAEAGRLAEQHPEIVLTGVHIGTYGAEHGTSLGALLHRLLREVPGPRYRLTSVEATEVDSQLAELLTSRDGGVAPHLHAPLQSGSDRVLRRMGRRWYTAARYARAIEALATAAAPFGLGADLITGFPGETEVDHQDTVRLVERLPFTYLHVFPWSPRPGTAATRMVERPQPADARRRAAELRALGDDKARRYRAWRAGGAADVVVVGGAGKRTGLTEDYLSVVLDDGALPRRARVAARLALRADGGLTAQTSAGPLVSLRRSVTTSVSSDSTASSFSS